MTLAGKKKILGIDNPIDSCQKLGQSRTDYSIGLWLKFKADFNGTRQDTLATNCSGSRNLNQKFEPLKAEL